MLLPKPIWKDIEGYEGKYQINQLGQVRSLNYKRMRKIKRIKHSKQKNGYLYIILYDNSNSKKTYYIHRLVAQTFLSNLNNYKEVNHIDENKENNCVWNLEWCTHEYNINYGSRNEKHSEKMKRYKGEKHWNFGKHLSDEAINKISEAKKGKNPLENMTEEAKGERSKKISESKKGHIVSDKTKRKISKTRIEKGIGKGKSHPNAKSVICLTTKKIFLTVQDAMKEYNIKSTSEIGKCCKGKVKSCGKLSNGTKLVWKYLSWKHNKKYRISNK